DTGRKSRMRGLENRISDLLGEDEAGYEALQEAMQAARKLPGEGWRERVRGGVGQGPMEEFLAHLRTQVLARCQQPDSPYSIECGPGEAVPGLLEAAKKLEGALARLAAPLTALAKSLLHRLDEEAEELDSATRLRIDAAVQGISR